MTNLAPTLSAAVPVTSGTAATNPSLGADLRLLGRQIRFEQRAFWRNRSRAFFAVAFPLVFLLVFNAVNGGHHIDELGGIGYSTWFVPGILAYGLIMATFANLATALTVTRDLGILKRIEGTPLPRSVFIAGCVGSALISALILVGATLCLGVFAYGVEIRIGTLPGLIAILVAGSVCFTTLGIAITALIPNAEAAPAIVNVVILPLTFISGIWMVLGSAPRWLDTLAAVFPVHALAHGLQHAFHPASAAPGFVGSDLAVLGLWTVGGLVASLRWFRWESRR